MILGPDGRPIPRPELHTEIATIEGGRDVTRGYVDDTTYLLPQDEVLRHQGAEGYKIFEKLLQDDRVYSTLAQRRAAVTARDYEVVPGGKMRRDRIAADYMREVLEHLQWNALTDKMLYTSFYGYSVAEAIWARDGRYIVPEALHVRNRRRFVFGTDMRPRLLTTNNPNGEPLPEHKFWTSTTGADNDDEPYGRGLGHYLYWPVWFKKNQIKFWLVFLEKFGQPTILGRYERNAKEEERVKLYQALRSVHADAVVALPHDMIVELLEASRGGSVDYGSFYDRMQSVISHIILSQTMTSESGSSRAQAEVHLAVRREVVESDARYVDDSFNRQPGAWLTAWNFPGASVPKVKRVMTTPEDMERMAQRDKTIVDMGRNLDADYVEETYNVRLERERPPAPADPAFAEGDEDDPPGVLTDRLAEEGNPLVADLLAPIRAIMEEADSLEEVRDRLLDAYPDMGIDDLAALMQRALAAAELAGRDEEEEA